MKTILLTFFCISFLSVFGQRTCSAYNDQQATAFYNLGVFGKNDTVNPFYSVDHAVPETETEFAVPSVIQIPVVVHVLYQTNQQNISDAQIASQIAALNRDFRKRNADTVNIPLQFKHLAADVAIEFVLANVDPAGLPTNGIVRMQTNVKEWLMDDNIKKPAKGGSAAWDSNSYLNIWVGNFAKGLGYSSPLYSPAETDGIVINYTVFGTLGKSGVYHMGRTLVHEAGHWLGLKHIWGDDACGDDGVADTPKQAGFTTGCPSGMRTTCGSNETGDMYMNYMDFTNDACTNLFTIGQKDRMRAVFQPQGPRRALLYSKGLNGAATENSHAAVPEVITPVFNKTSETEKKLETIRTFLNLYPNPAVHEIVLEFNDDNWVGKEIHINNSNGILVYKMRITAARQLVNISRLNPGMYFIIAEQNGKFLANKFIKSGSVQ